MIEQNPRIYGRRPFNVAVIHGGPGAAGEMKPVAEYLSDNFGVIEPLQTKETVTGQIEELGQIVENNADCPIALIGFSWGAWLSLLTATRYPVLVGKIILVGSGPFEERYAESIMKTRLSRLTEDEHREWEELGFILTDESGEVDDMAFKRFGELLSKTDSYNPIDDTDTEIDFRPDIFENVWEEVSEMRKSGELLRNVASVKCPVVAIHGDYDPHPAEGVREPLARILQDFEFILLEKCGHKPWVEKYARDRFYEVLKAGLS